jgi:hypothetical protein
MSEQNARGDQSTDEYPIANEYPSIDEIDELQELMKRIRESSDHIETVIRYSAWTRRYTTIGLSTTSTNSQRSRPKTTTTRTRG